MAKARMFTLRREKDRKQMKRNFKKTYKVVILNGRYSMTGKYDIYVRI